MFRRQKNALVLPNCPFTWVKPQSFVSFLRFLSQEERRYFRNLSHTPTFGNRMVFYPPKISYSFGEKPILDSETIFLLLRHASLLAFLTQKSNSDSEMYVGKHLM